MKESKLTQREIIRLGEIFEDYKKSSEEPQKSKLEDINTSVLVRMREFLIDHVRKYRTEELGSKPNIKKAVYYSELFDKFGITRDCIGDCLGAISELESENGRPLLSAIVVRKDNKMPGEGFYLFFPKLRTKAERREAWYEEINKLAAYWK